jgi:hypothetical protein
MHEGVIDPANHHALTKRGDCRLATPLRLMSVDSKPIVGNLPPLSMQKSPLAHAQAFPPEYGEAAGERTGRPSCGRAAASPARGPQSRLANARSAAAADQMRPRTKAAQNKDDAPSTSRNIRILSMPGC